MKNTAEKEIMMRVFISHSSKDTKIAAAVCGALEASGHSCFIAPRDIKGGGEYAKEVVNGIDGADILLLLLSEKSNQSSHVLKEVERAGSRSIPIMVYKLEEVELTKSLEHFLMTNQWIDGTEDYHCSKVLEAFKNLSDISRRPPQKQRDTVTEHTQKQKQIDAVRAKQSGSQSKENTKKSVTQPKTASKQEKQETGRGKKIALVILSLSFICGVILVILTLLF